jgi:hypothetical protein
MANRSRQKTLRARMRAIGFYITDFVTDQRGFVVSDFDDLIRRGVIVVDDGEAKVSPSRVAQGKAVSRTSPRKSAEEREQARARRELAAQRHKPEKVDLLLVAEAPPASLDRYFYFHTFVSRTVSSAMSVGLFSAGSLPGRRKPNCSQSSETVACSLLICRKNRGMERR